MAGRAKAEPLLTRGGLLSEACRSMLASYGHDTGKEAPEGMLTEEDDVEIPAGSRRAAGPSRRSAVTRLQSEDDPQVPGRLDRAQPAEMPGAVSRLHRGALCRRPCVEATYCIVTRRRRLRSLLCDAGP